MCVCVCVCCSVKLNLWDTAGQEMFSKLTRTYYREAKACVFVFGTDDRESFLEIERWQHRVEQEVTCVCVCVCGWVHLSTCI
jgi:GTPase SAR1 family protein